MDIVILIPWWLIVIGIALVAGAFLGLMALLDDGAATRAALQPSDEDPIEEWKRNGMQGPVPNRRRR